MNKNKKRVDLYHVENIFLVVIIISLIIAISLNNQNIYYLKKELSIPKDEENEIRKKAKYIAWVYVVASIYFAYVAYLDYAEEKNKTRKLFFIAALILVVSSLIRLYNLYFSNVNIEGSEDYAL